MGLFPFSRSFRRSKLLFGKALADENQVFHRWISKESRRPMTLEVFRQRLLRRREDIMELRSVSDESRRPVELDQTRVGRLSRMDALQEQAMSLETERRRQQELKRIEAALQRIEEGEFGYCVICGDEIEVRRLELDPTLPTCIACAKH